MDIKLIQSPKSKGAVFLKVKGSQDHFICKVYPQLDAQNTERIVRVIKKSLKHIPATVIQDHIELEDDGYMPLGEKQARMSTESNQIH